MIDFETQKLLDDVESYVLAVSVINLDNVARNYKAVTEKAGKGVEAAAVVKADSYGMGAIQISRRLYKEGCRKFFVATALEGVELRSAIDDDTEIYVLCGVMAGAEQIFYDYKLIPVLTNMYQVDVWHKFSEKLNKKLSAVIHVDTGMVRNGLSAQDIDKYASYISEIFDIKFIMSHLACADIFTHVMNKQQLDLFIKYKSQFGDVKGSLSATNGVFLGKEYCFDVIRPGKALYGFAVREDKIGEFEPVVDIYARIVQINNVYIGESIGYGATFVATKNMKTVTIGMGYADGFMRKFSGFGCGFLAGKEIPIVGRISMDYIVLDVTDLDESAYKIGDFVALTNHTDSTLEKWALELDTIPHEVSCRLGRRVKKIYRGKY